MERITKPNYTQIPNVYLDEIMQTLTGSENLVFLVIMRKTFGWHKTRDKISYAQIRKSTGISSYATIQKALAGLEGKNLIVAIKENTGISYEVVVEDFTENVKGEETDLYRNCKATFTETVKVNTETFTETVNTKESNINKDKENIYSRNSENEEVNQPFATLWNNRISGKKRDCMKSKAYEKYKRVVKKFTPEEIATAYKNYTKQMNREGREEQYIKQLQYWLQEDIVRDWLHVEQEERKTEEKKPDMFYSEILGMVIDYRLSRKVEFLHSQGKSRQEIIEIMGIQE